MAVVPRKNNEPSTADDCVVLKPKPPNRRQFESKIQSQLTEIQTLENELHRVQTEDSSSHQRLRQLRSRKESSLNQRKTIDHQLQSLNKEIGNKRDAMVKLQGNLQYKNDDRINEAIKRLEDQLRVNNFKVSEEKKIVQEIDRLRRSKKVLGEYLVIKEEVDEMRIEQKYLRDQRDNLFREFNLAKAEEEKTRRKTEENKERIGSIKIELTKLREEKRLLTMEYRKATAECLHLKDLQKQEKRKRKDQIIRKKEDECVTCDIEPYQEERRICAALMAYLQRLVVTPTTPLTPSSEIQSPITPIQEIQEGSMVYVLHKRDKEDEDGFVKVQRSGKNRRDRKRIQVKPLSHNPEMLEQFGKVHVTPPATLQDISLAIERLSAQQRHYISLAAAAAAPCSVSCSADEQPHQEKQEITDITPNTSSTENKSNSLEREIKDLSLSLQDFTVDSSLLLNPQQDEEKDTFQTISTDVPTENSQCLCKNSDIAQSVNPNTIVQCMENDNLPLSKFPLEDQNSNLSCNCKINSVPYLDNLKCSV